MRGASKTGWPAPTSIRISSLQRRLPAATSAVDALRDSDAMRDMLGDAFVDLYTALKDAEYQEFQEIITPWEREILMFNV